MLLLVLQEISQDPEVIYQQATDLQNSQQLEQAISLAITLLNTTQRFKAIQLVNKICQQNPQIPCATTNPTAFSPQILKQLTKNTEIANSNNITNLLLLYNKLPNNTFLQQKIYFLSLQQNDFKTARKVNDTEEIALIEEFQTLNFKISEFSKLLTFFSRFSISVNRPKRAQINDLLAYLKGINFDEISFPEIRNEPLMKQFLEVSESYLLSLKGRKIELNESNSNGVVQALLYGIRLNNIRLEFAQMELDVMEAEITSLRAHFNRFLFSEEVKFNVKIFIKECNQLLDMILQLKLDALVPDFYGILNVQKNASQQEIKQAYRELSKKYHPDFNKSSSTEQFSLLGEAFQTLGNEKNKKIYDSGNYAADEKNQRILIHQKKNEAALKFGPGYTGDGGAISDEEMRQHMTEEQWKQYKVDQKMKGR